MKTCTRCKEQKPRDSSHFPPHTKTKDGLDSWCRKCRATYRNEICRGRFRATMTDDELKKLKLNQTSCQICGKQTDLVVDHNHTTMIVRGILCNHCNRGIGHFLDDVDLLEKAIDYLKQTSNPRLAAMR